MASSPTKPTNAKRGRPLSPHLGIYKWGPAMLVSILHRVTGSGVALVGLPLFAWWLAAAAAGKESYATFLGVFTTDTGALNIVGWVLAVGLSFAFFQHLASGIRHFFLDAGAAFELGANRRSAQLTLVASALLTFVFWLVVKGVLA